MEEIDINNLLSAAVGATIGGLIGVAGTVWVNRKSPIEKEINRLRLRELEVIVAGLEEENSNLEQEIYIYKPDSDQKAPDTPIKKINVNRYNRRKEKISYGFEEDSITREESELLERLLGL